MGVERAEKEEILKWLWIIYQLGLIDLYFGDESAFSMNPKLPYGWSPAGERIKIFPQRDKKINLFGVFRPDNFCLAYESADNINSDFLIRSIDDFSRYVEKPTVLVLDNASGASFGEVFSGSREMAGKRFVYLLFAKVFTAFESGRNLLEKSQIRMAATNRLRFVCQVQREGQRNASIILDYNTKSNSIK